MSCSFVSLRVRTGTIPFLTYSRAERQDRTKSVSLALLAVPRRYLSILRSNTSAVLEASVGNLFLPPTPKRWLHRPLPLLALRMQWLPWALPPLLALALSIKTFPPCPSQVPWDQDTLPWSGMNSAPPDITSFRSPVTFCCGPTLSIFMLEVRKPRHREVKPFVPIHTGSKR